jgi:hypothetical protein
MNLNAGRQFHKLKAESRMGGQTKPLKDMAIQNWNTPMKNF